MLTGMQPRSAFSARRNGGEHDVRAGKDPSPTTPLDLPGDVTYPALDLPRGGLPSAYPTVADDGGGGAYDWIGRPAGGRRGSKVKDVLSLMDGAWFGNDEPNRERASYSDPLTERVTISSRNATTDIAGTTVAPPTPQPGRRSSPAEDTPMPATQLTSHNSGGSQLGTWTQRVTFFLGGGAADEPEPEPQPAPKGGGSSVPVAAAGPALQPPTEREPERKPAAQSRQVARSVSSGASWDEDAAVEAAWRWRFGRRWAAEQSKQFDPNFGADGGGEEWDEALGYLQACGDGWNMQLARTTSLDKSLTTSLLSNGLGSGDGTLLLNDSLPRAPRGGLKDTVELAATREVAGIARKAKTLMQHQTVIERSVAERLTRISSTSASKDGAWLGGHLPAVQIDSWGRFTYVLVRLSDQTGRAKLLVRGKNFSDGDKLMQALSSQAAALAAQYSLPLYRLAVVGSGVMEWCRDRDRRLNVMRGTVVSGADPAISTPGDVAQLAAALTRGQLPVNYSISVDEKKV